MIKEDNLGDKCKLQYFTKWAVFILKITESCKLVSGYGQDIFIGKEYEETNRKYQS